MHDVAEKYYEDATASMEKFRATVEDLSAQLAAELMAHKVAFDAEWVRRMRDFKGEGAATSAPEQPGLPKVQPLPDMYLPEDTRDPDSLKEE